MTADAAIVVWTRSAVAAVAAEVQRIADALSALEADYGPDPRLDARWDELARLARSFGVPLTRARELPPLYMHVEPEPRAVWIQ